MPLPTPRKDEDKDNFIDRCMGNDVMNKDYPDASQRRAICEKQWDNRGKKKKTEMQYPHVLGAIHNTVWAIMPEKLQAILDFIDLKIATVSVSQEQVTDITANAATKFKEVKGKIAVLPLFGIIAQRVNMMTRISGGTSTELFGADFDAAINDKDIGAIVINIHSPGGTIYGIHELSEKIYKARGKKRITAMVNSLAASAAYWIASAADEIVMTPSGEVGSIGVLAIHTDISEAERQAGIKRTFVKAGKYKTEANPHEALGHEGQIAIQARVDDYYAMMIGDIARNRNINESKVVRKFGEGRIVGAREARENGMIDAIRTYEGTIKKLQAKPVKSKWAMRERRELIA